MLKHVLPTLILTCLVAFPAEAQSRRELAERIDATEVRIGELEDQFLAGDPVADTLLRRLDDLEYQVRELTGRTEQLDFENRQLRDQIERLEREARQRNTPRLQPADGSVVIDPQVREGVTIQSGDDEAVAWMREGLDESTSAPAGNPDDRFAADRAAATGVLGAPESIGPAPTATSRPSPDALYDTARAQLLDGDFNGAQDGFEQFVGTYPEHERAGEAWYWLGETFFVRSDLAEAADAYIASLRADSAGAKAPDALVRLAASLNGLGRRDDACATLGRFSSQFPNADLPSRQRAEREAARIGCR
ncbi:tol-pal system protein YbgF [Maricaulis sp. CAU 1757]